MGVYIYFEKRICHPSSSSHFLSASGRESSMHSLWLCGLLSGALFQVYPCCSYLNRMLKDLMFYKSIFKTRSLEMGVGKNLNYRHPAARVIAVTKACVTKGRTTCLFGCGVSHLFSIQVFLYRMLQQQRAKRKEAAPNLGILAPAVCSLSSHELPCSVDFRCLMFA